MSPSSLAGLKPLPAAADTLSIETDRRIAIAQLVSESVIWSTKLRNWAPKAEKRLDMRDALVNYPCMHMETTASEIAKALAADVHDGALLPGDMFPSERDLCDRFGVGRNTVRNALTNLQAMGLMDHARGRRPRVALPTLSRAMASVSDAARFFLSGTEGRAHLEQARLFMETSMLRHAVENATNAQIARMVAAIEECDANLDNRIAFRNADVKFHRVLAEIPGNPIFVALHEAFVERLMKSRKIPSDFEDSLRRSNEEHKQIVSAVLDKDGDRAEAILTRHLARNYASHFRQALERPAAEDNESQ